MKYEITDIHHPDNPNLDRIRALKSFGDVKILGSSKVVDEEIGGNTIIRELV